MYIYLFIVYYKSVNAYSLCIIPQHFHSASLVDVRSYRVASAGAVNKVFHLKLQLLHVLTNRPTEWAYTTSDTLEALSFSFAKPLTVTLMQGLLI
jgi:hypothetical protein